MPLVEEQYPIPGFPDYMITKSGEVWSYKKKNPRRLTPYNYPTTGLMHSLQLATGVRTITTLHRLLGLTFIPNPKKLPVVRHKDINKLNNALSNLEWAKRVDVSQKMMTHFVKNDDKRRSANRTPERKAIRAEYLKGGVSMRELCEKHNIPMGTMYYIIREARDE